jgi:hypothetical protein
VLPTDRFLRMRRRPGTKTLLRRVPPPVWMRLIGTRERYSYEAKENEYDEYQIVHRTLAFPSSNFFWTLARRIWIDKGAIDTGA